MPGQNLDVINQTSVSKASEIVVASHNPELANYFYDLLEKEISINRSEDKYKEFLQKQQEFKQLVHDLNYGIDRHWKGHDILSDYQKLHENLAKRQADVVQAYMSANKQGALSMHFAFGDNAEFLRAYQIANQKADDKLNGAMDQMFTTWLSKNHWMNKGGFICEVDESSNSVKLDAANNPVKADINQVRAAFNDERTGFKKFIAEKNASFSDIKFYEQKIPNKSQATPASGV